MSKKTGVIIASILLCLAIGISGGIVWFQKSSNEETEFEAFYQDFTDEDVKYEDGELYVDSQILLTAAGGTSRKEVQKLVKSFDGEIVGYLSVSDDYQVQFPEGKTLDELKEIVEKMQGEEYIEAVSIHQVMHIPEDSVAYYSDPWVDTDHPTDTSGSEWSEMNPSGNNWWAEAIMLPSVWKMNTEFQEVKVGIYDSMFDITHADLVNRFEKTWNNPKDEKGDCSVASLYKDAKERMQSTENYEHGTHVAGIIAAQGGNKSGVTGVAQNAKLCGYAFLGTSDNEPHMSGYCSVYELKYAILLMLEEKVKLINMSVGNSDLLVAAQKGNETAQEDLKKESQSMENFLLKCFEKYDFLLIKSAGNDSRYNWVECEPDAEHPYGYERQVENGKYVQGNEVYDTKFDYIGAIENETVKAHVIVVGSVTNDSSDSQGSIEYNTGAVYYYTNFSNQGKRVDVYAPGSNILSTLPNDTYGLLSGTSMSTPIVTGIAALVWGANPDLSAEQVKEIIKKSVFKSVEAAEESNSVGIVDARCAVMFAGAEEGKTENQEYEAFGSVLGFIYQIKSDEDGDPVPASIDHVTIQIFDQEKELIQETTSDELGSYQMFLDAGLYEAAIQKEGYNNVLREFEITAGQAVCKDFQMEESQTLFSVVDSESGESIPHVRCTITSLDENMEPVRQNTGANGKASVSLPSGKYTITLKADGYDDKTFDFEVKEGENTQLGDIEMEMNELVKALTSGYWWNVLLEVAVYKFNLDGTWYNLSYDFDDEYNNSILPERLEIKDNGEHYLQTYEVSGNQLILHQKNSYSEKEWSTTLQYLSISDGKEKLTTEDAISEWDSPNHEYPVKMAETIKYTGEFFYESGYTNKDPDGSDNAFWLLPYQEVIDAYNNNVMKINEKEINQIIIDYYSRFLDSGNLVIFEDESIETDYTYEVVLRYQISNEEAQRFIENGYYPTANKYYQSVTVDKTNREVKGEYGDVWILP